jgi:hypothetical protein
VEFDIYKYIPRFTWSIEGKQKCIFFNLLFYVKASLKTYFLLIKLAMAGANPTIVKLQRQRCKNLQRHE